ncbi:MAG: NAD-dependent epimerase/dehydratase family protein [Deltaproteobacteria bacterium]|nr:NAD-dependent epimerase/dehydratase family protein [Deltaproteobacteria bacterium]
MKVIVTGGAGFIGSHIVDAFIERAHQVFVIDNLSTGDRRHLNRKAEFYAMDILEPTLPELFVRISPDVVCHHAAQMDVRRSVTDPVFDARVNVLGLIQVLEASRISSVKKVLFASSGGAIYGEQEIFPAPEGHPTRPMSPYGVSKLAGEFYLAYYHRAFGMPYVALRYSNVYGPRQSASGEAGVVAIFLRHLVQGQPPTINGDGLQTRDYVYVEDVAGANILAAEAPFSGALNIGTARETDVCTLFSLLKQKAKSGISAVHGPAKPGEQRRSSIDPSQARAVWRWEPRVFLEEGLERTIQYYHEQTFA